MAYIVFFLLPLPQSHSSFNRSCITQAFLLASRTPHACHLQGWQRLTREAESSASGFMSSTLWSTARRPQRDWGEAMTLRRARVAGRPLFGWKTKFTWQIGEKGQKNQLLNPTICLLQFPGISYLRHRTALVDLTVVGVGLIEWGLFCSWTFASILKILSDNCHGL